MKGQMLKLFVVVTVCLAVAAGCMAPPPSPAPTPVPPTATPAPTPLDIVQKYQDAVGRHDVDTAMAMFTEDAKYAWGSYFTTSDKTMIRNWHEFTAALNSRMKANDCKTSDSTVTCEWRFVHDCFGAEGAIGVGYDMGGTIVFTVKEGKISEYVLAESPDPEYSQWEQAFFKWLDGSHPMEIVSVVQSLQTWKFDRDFGQRLLKFCKEQAASLKSAAGATSDLTAPVQAWVDALNSGDVDATLALFADDLKFDVFEYHARNKDELRGIFDWLAGLETKYQIKKCQTKDDRVVCTMPVSDACIAGYDPVAGLMSNMTFVSQQDGKIAQVNGMPDGFDDYYAKWISPGTIWMRANRAEELAKVESTSDGREAGSIQAKLCKEYGESLKLATTTTADNKGDADAALGDLKLTILFDNTAIDPRLKSGWGFAALVEYSGHTLLFDTGADGSMLLDNMRQLDVDPQSIEAVIFSHEHGDHTQGLQALLDTGVRPTVYAPSAFSSAFKEQVRARTELVEVTDALEILPGMHLTRPVGAIVEQALAVETQDGTAIITGCAHPGVANMVREAQEVVPGKVSMLVGGFHLLEIADKDKLQSVIAELRQLGVERILPTHCTGDGAINLFRTEFGEDYLDGGVGRTVASSAAGRAALPAPASTPLPTAVGAGVAGDQLKVIQAYYAALNSGDVDATLALFTDDVKFRGENYATGKEMLRGVFDWLAGTEVKHGPPDCQSQNDRVVCAFSIGDACIAASGATDGLPAQGEYLIQPDGKIREASESLGGAGWDDYIEWDNSFQGWAMLNRAEEWRGFGHSKEFAPRLAKLCKEYAESLK